METSQSRTWRRLWLGLAALGLLALIEGSGRARFGRAGLGPDLVLSAVIAWAFASDAHGGALWGFVGGLMLDALSSGPFGAHALAMTVVGAVVGAGRLSVYADIRVWGTIAGVAGSALFYALFLPLLALAGWGAPLLPSLRLIVLPVVLMDTACVLALLWPMQALKRRFFRAPSVA